MVRSLLRVVRQEAFEPPQCAGGVIAVAAATFVCLFTAGRVASGAGQMSAAALLL